MFVSRLSTRRVRSTSSALTDIHSFHTALDPAEGSFSCSFGMSKGDYCLYLLWQNTEDLWSKISAKSSQTKLNSMLEETSIACELTEH